MPTKNTQHTLSSGQLDNVAYIPTERPCALALTFQRDNTTEKGLGEELTETDQGQAQKVKS